MVVLRGVRVDFVKRNRDALSDSFLEVLVVGLAGDHFRNLGAVANVLPNDVGGGLHGVGLEGLHAHKSWDGHDRSREVLYDVFHALEHVFETGLHHKGVVDKKNFCVQYHRRFVVVLHDLATAGTPMVMRLLSGLAKCLFFCSNLFGRWLRAWVLELNVNGTQCFHVQCTQSVDNHIVAHADEARQTTAQRAFVRELNVARLLVVVVVRRDLHGLELGVALGFGFSHILCELEGVLLLNIAAVRGCHRHRILARGVNNIADLPDDLVKLPLRKVELFGLELAVLLQRLDLALAAEHLEGPDD
eukprot:PhM_4_TR3027/c1_g1_i1/m.46407